MSRRADARGTVHGETNVLVVCDDGCLARVDANPNAHLGLLRPRMARERALRINGGADGVLRLPKGNEERVPLGVDLVPAGVLERGSQQPLVVGHHLRVAVSQPSQQLSRALDVREEESDGACWKLRRHSPFIGRRARTS